MNLINVDGLTDQLLRPPRFTYSVSDLGPVIFEHNSIIYERIDFYVCNNEDIKISCSFWHNKNIRLLSEARSAQLQGQNRSMTKQYNEFQDTVMIYLHCNCGSRVQSLQLMKPALDLGFCFLSYDSRGCGHSEGKYISLGYHEIRDLEGVIQHVNHNFLKNPKIILWGRSMGAVTAMNYLTNTVNSTQNASVKVAVLDSPFLSLNELICDFVNKKIGVPKIIVDMILRYLEPEVKRKVGFNIFQFNLRGKISQIVCPLILMASKSDGLVPFQHLEQIYDSHHGRKSIIYLNEAHTDQRLAQTIRKVFQTLNKYLYLSNEDRSLDIKRLKQHKLGGKFKSNLSSCRSSELRIAPVCPVSAIKPKSVLTDFSDQKNGVYASQKRKKKLSLSNCKTTHKQNGQYPRKTIHLFSKQNPNNVYRDKILQKIEKHEKLQKKSLFGLKRIVPQCQWLSHPICEKQNITKVAWKLDKAQCATEGTVRNFRLSEI